MIGSKPVGGYDLGALVISGLQLHPLCFHERGHHFFNESLTLRLRFNGVQKKRVLHEELPQVFAVFTVVFELGVMFAEMLGDCFIDSLLHCFTVQPQTPPSTCQCRLKYGSEVSIALGFTDRVAQMHQAWRSLGR